MNVPEIITYSIVSKGTAVAFPGFGNYLPLYTGVQSITVSVRGGTGSVHLSTTAGYKTRYQSVNMADGQTVVLPNVARPEGTTRFLSFFSNTDGADYSVTILKY
ncbi:hypothetical protein HMPREF2978_04745 [Corynebacterium sp. HMSC074C01]|uniref:hypothetical protein n=1 Tax=Corynebacterium sp. HMSC074C01 TaxID=1739482 RepID=UPI0008A590AD|nr:hypothetical protein [Corynebacterium sp. HMSC074C01]OFP66492.1 hypothetical protein HMPREF2978_04745 [Corynebacterium sp. HMSC074C01]